MAGMANRYSADNETSRKRLEFFVQRWKSGAIAASPSDVNTVNDSLKPIANAVGAADVRRVVVESARAVDAEVDSLDPGFLARVEAEGTAVKLNRSLHREHHLQQMQGMLAAVSP